MKDMSLKVNKCLSKAGYMRKDQYFVRKLRKDTAHRLDVGEYFFSSRFPLFHSFFF